MSEMDNNNQNTKIDPEMQNSGNTDQSSPDGQQYYNNPNYNNEPYYGGQQYYYNGQPGNNGQTDYNGQQYYNNGQNYNNQQYYGQNTDYNPQQYYGQNTGGNDQQYYEQNTSYSNQQYYGQNTGGNNQQYYGQYTAYNNQQYYGQNAGYGNQQYYGQNTGYGNQQYYGYGQQPYANPQTTYRPAEPVLEPVTNIFYYTLMALSAVSLLISLIAAKGLITNMFSSIDYNSMAGQDFSSMYSSMMYSFSNAPGYAAYSVLSSLLGFAILAVSIIDIVCVHKKGYPILGLILFTILCKPGYFIWRAYVLKQKKTIPILYTVAYVLFYIGYFIWCFSFMINMIA